MLSLPCVLLLVTAGVVSATALPGAFDDASYALPADFLIGAGLAAVQTEGAWNEGGKSESMVDHVVHSGNLSALGWHATHDISADSYHRYKEDVAMAAKLKLQMYRFSISWARVLPDSDPSKPNKVGVDYYHSLIDEILKYNMIPLVTIFHHDHPQILEDEFNGWQDKRMVGKFQEYAKFVFEEYSSKVKLWTTINEPNIYCWYWPENIAVASGKDPGTVDINIYSCFHNFVLAHAAAYRVFREGNYEGTVGFTVTSLLSRPRTTLPEDVYASDVYNQIAIGSLLHPLVYGDYPQVVKEVVGDKLPKFTDEEKEMVKNSTDFIGLNVYYGLSVAYRDPSTPAETIIALPLNQLFKEANFLNVAYLGTNGEERQDYPMTVVAPAAIRNSIQWTWLHYKKPIMITENGMGGHPEDGVEDMHRAVYYSAFLRAMVDTMNEFGAKVIGYCAWSLLDSFEWRNGYDLPFGLVHVDFKNGTLKRTLKKSSSFWVELAKRRVVPLVTESPSSSSSSVTALGKGPAMLLGAVVARIIFLFR